MSALIGTLDRWLYPQYGNNWDNWRFRSIVVDNLKTADYVLDLGAGAGVVEPMRLRGKAARICGVDPDERVKLNPYLDEARVGWGNDIPYPDNEFDVVISNNVLEHLDDPASVLREISRVLKPGGLFLSKTPNKWYYVSLIASCTPHWFHEWVNERRGRRRSDTFPTRYRANTPGAMRRLARQCSFEVEQIEMLEGRPEYLRMSVPTYFVGWMYERFVNLVPGMSGLRAAMITKLRKSGGTTERVAIRRAA